MPLFPGDFKKMKYVSHDDDYVTLGHPAGHEFRISRKAITNKDARAQMDALCMGGKISAKPEVAMAKGGKVSEEEQYVEELVPDYQNDPIVVEPMDVQPSNTTPLQKAYNAEALRPDSSFGMAKGVMESTPPPDSSFDAQGQFHGDLDLGKYEAAKDAVMLEQDDAAMANMEDQQRQAAITDLGIAPQQQAPMGAAPASIPGALAEDQAAETAAPAQDESALGRFTAGVNKEAQAMGQLGEQQAAMLQQAAVGKQEAEANYQQRFSELEQERAAFMQDIKEGHVDPQKYWDNNSRIMSGIGMILAGFNPTNSPNAAINYIKAQMEMNLDAQKSNLSSKHNLLRANMEAFGNLREATDMTRIMQNDMVADQLKIAAAKAQTPLAQAAALKAAAQFEVESAEKTAQFAKAKATADMVAAIRDPSRSEMAINALETVDPKLAGDYREKSVPGLGVASSLEGAKGVREMQATYKTVKDGIARLKEITKTTGKSLSPDTRAEAESLRTQLIGRLRVPLTGPGAMNEGERALLMKAVPSPTDLFSLDSRTMKKLETLEKGVVNAYRNMATANGLRVPDESGGSNKNAQAKAWLKANPKHPKAAAVRKALGE